MTNLYSVFSQASLYRQLIEQVQRLHPAVKLMLAELYQQFSSGLQPAASNYPSVTHDKYPALASIDIEGDIITTCFGCQCASESSKPTEHVIEWGTGKVYAWCIWDAFFISQQVAKPAQISSVDPISQQRIDIFFDGEAFITSALWFSFPLGDSPLGSSLTPGAKSSMSSSIGGEDASHLRSCFCCRTKAFTDIEHAERFAQAHQCEVVDIQQMLQRTAEMVQALQSS